jgi:CheY-like chemotaxis protein
MKMAIRSSGSCEFLEKSHESALPSIALSDYARSEDRTRAIRSGFQNHLAKPVEPAELLAVISSPARRMITTSPSSRKVSNTARGGDAALSQKGLP